MSQEAKFIGEQAQKIGKAFKSQPMGYVITLLLISVIAVTFLSIFGMVEINIYICGTLINSFFWLDFIYNYFGYFVLVYAIMLGLSMVLERKGKYNIYIGTLETEGTKLWQVRLVFIIIISVFILLIIFDLTFIFRINVSFAFMVITPNTLAEQVIKQMYNLIWMAFCAFGIAIIVVR